MAVQSDVMEATGPYDRARALNAFKLGDVTFYWITRVCAISVLLILGGMHFFNLYVFSRIRRSAQGPRRPVTPPPPVAPDAVLNLAIPR